MMRSSQGHLTINKDLMAVIEEIIKKNRRLITYEIAETMFINNETFSSIFHQRLGYKKL